MFWALSKSAPRNLKAKTEATFTHSDGLEVRGNPFHRLPFTLSPSQCRNTSCFLFPQHRGLVPAHPPLGPWEPAPGSLMLNIPPAHLGACSGLETIQTGSVRPAFAGCPTAHVYPLFSFFPWSLPQCHITYFIVYSIYYLSHLTEL